jgi:CubicO group peptidase (beta-lactamase class C family)
MERRNFIKSTSLTALALQIPNVYNWDSIAESEMKLASPESLGIDSQSILDFIAAANASDIQWHNYVLLRHGKIASQGSWKPFDLNNKHTLYSLSKSFTSTAIGMLVDEGKLKVTEPVINFFKDDLPEVVSDNLKKMTVHHLLTMNTGHNTECIDKFRSSNDKWSKIFLHHDVPNEPGSKFMYNTPATYMLGAILHKVTGKTVSEYLKPRLFDKLEIKDYDWEVNKEGLNMAGWGLRLNPKDIAKFGQLYLQKGKWNGNQIISERWVAEATKKQTTSNPGDSDWSQGYGYQFWRCKHNLYRGDGAFGQYCIVIPDQDAVMVVNSESGNLQKNMTIIYDTILKGMKSTPMKENKELVKQLRNAENSLAIKPIQNKAKPILPAQIEFLMADNAFELSKAIITDKASHYLLSFHTSNEVLEIKAGKEQWIINPSNNKPYLFGTQRRYPMPSNIAASGAFISDKEFQIELRFVEAVHGDKLIFKIDGYDSMLTFKSSLTELSANNQEERSPIKVQRG